MKIYYSRFAGIKYIFFVLLLFLSTFAYDSKLNIANINIANINIALIIQVVLGLYSLFVIIKQLLGRKFFEVAPEGVYIYSGLIIEKETFIPKDNLVSATYKEAKESDPNLDYDIDRFIEFKVKEDTRLDKTSNSNITIDRERLVIKLHLNQCNFSLKEWKEISTYLEKNYNIDVI